MAKRSRDDFEPPSESDNLANTEALPVTHFTSVTPYSTKILQLDPETPETCGEGSSFHEMKCSLPPHRETLSFPSLEAFEVHYRKVHLNRCLECRKNFPTEYFLNLHIEENHDSIISVRKERGEKIYACFVEDCERNCSTPEKRRMHMIDKHAFPKDYDFSIVKVGIDNRSSMLMSGRHRRRSSAAQHKTGIEERANRRNSTLETISGEADQNEGNNTTKKEMTTPTTKDVDMEGLTGAMSSLKFVPPSVQFGRGRGRARGGFSRT
ncbi:hypothetical protein BJ875DRAFT_503975 [Amylocarpus encephaloides]|uniref:C2H2-type domain-containing protein n=1 Tax=Amylocarpus encephaloides TaxID=45428 RepID=A0A9P7YLQ1_9HELO|nr:hypothetical protein BJ875DRAFT_503975 [Amylocarpus encephaloides]